MANRSKGLFQRWLEIEKGSGKSLTQVLVELNTACGTAYQSNYPAVMASRNYSLDRLPTAVRRHMLTVVLPVELGKKGITVSPAELQDLVLSLT